MARAAVLDLLAGDATLATLGGTGFVVVPNFAADQRPNDRGAFIVICWRTTDFETAVQANAAQHFELYVHLPIKVSTDFVLIGDILDRCDEIFAAVEDTPVVGEDGWQLDYVGFEGRGPDFKDEGYETICKQAAYYALSCPAPAEVGGS